MKNYKGSRFLIDAIDRRLGSVEKELKFDRIMILIGVLCAIVPAMLMPVVVEKIPKLSLLLLVVAMFGIVLIITMTKEYINDYKKSKNAKNQ
jgi:hypothetical protein